MVHIHGGLVREEVHNVAHVVLNPRAVQRVYSDGQQGDRPQCLHPAESR